MLATVAAVDSASTVRKKYSVFIYSEGEPHAMYAIYKQTLTLCVLQYITCVLRFYDTTMIYKSFVRVRINFSILNICPKMRFEFKVSEHRTTPFTVN